MPRRSWNVYDTKIWNSRKGDAGVLLCQINELLFDFMLDRNDMCESFNLNERDVTQKHSLSANHTQLPINVSIHVRAEFMASA